MDKGSSSSLLPFFFFASPLFLLKTVKKLAILAGTPPPGPETNFELKRIVEKKKIG